MTCESFSELCELYVLGLLESDERRAANEHLQTGCPICAKAVERALSLNAMISANVPQTEPSSALRRRIAESFGAKAGARRAFFRWLTAAAILLLSFGFLLDYTYRRGQSAEVERQNARFERAIQILEAAGTRMLHFGEEAAGAPHGTIYVNNRLGIVLTAAGLPETPQGWHYESWIVPKAGNPRAVGAFETNLKGIALAVMPVPIDGTVVEAVAVSLEPPGATLAKPTKVVFAAPL